MRATKRTVLGAGLAAAVAFGGVSQGVTAVPPGPRPAFTIHVRNYAAVPSSALAEAQRVATAIFRQAGVEARWAEIDMTAGVVQTVRIQDQPMALADIQVNILPDSAPIPAGVSDSVMGVAPGAGPDRTVVDVFDGRLRALFWRISSAYLKGDIDRRVSEGQLLGYVIAHEVGHLLLHQQGHSPSGIMRGEWAFPDFRDMASSMLLFTPQQAQVLRSDVVRRDAQEPTSVATTGSPSSAP
jgi:hypothetical protein